MKDVRGGWDAEFGDRRQELVFIGQSLDREGLTARLNACLLDDEEMARRDTWSGLPDPFVDV